MPPIFAKLAAVTERTAGVRRWGAAALDLAFVAAGRYDAFFEFGLAPWDVAAGMLLVREAGGMISDIAGKPYELGGPSLLASNVGLRDVDGRDPVQGLTAPAGAAVERGSAIGYCRAANPVERQLVIPTSSAAVRSLALAVFGLGVVPAYAQGSNVTAFGAGRRPPGRRSPCPHRRPDRSRAVFWPSPARRYHRTAGPCACDGLARCRAARDNCH